MSNIEEQKRIEQVKKAMGVIENKIPGIKIYNLGSDQSHLDIERQPCGSYLVDTILGGGLPVWRIIELYGKESSGKTTLSIIWGAAYTKAKKFVFFLDAEHSFDAEYAKKLGMDLNYVFVAQPDYGEQAIDILTGVVASGLFAYAIIDSVSALTPKSLVEGSAEDAAQIGALARLMSRGLSALTSKISVSRMTVTFINQVRVKIGGFAPGMGVPMDTTGGNALKFYASIRIDVRRAKDVMRKDLKIGQETIVRTVKNKTFPPFKEAQINLMFDPENNLWGTDSWIEMFDVIVEKDILGTRGIYHSLTGEKIKGEGGVPGRDKLMEYLRANPDQFEYLENRLKTRNETPVERVSETDMRVPDFKPGKIVKKEEIKGEDLGLTSEAIETLAAEMEDSMGGTQALTEAVELLKDGSSLEPKTLVEHMAQKGIKITWKCAKESIRAAKELGGSLPETVSEEIEEE